MHTFEIKAMTAAIAAKLGLSDLDRFAIQEVITACWADKIAIVWNDIDVLDSRPNLTQAQAMDVLYTVLHDHDATRGVNWDTIENCAVTLFGKNGAAVVDDDAADDKEEEKDATP